VLLKVEKFNWSARSLVNIFSVVKKNEMKGTNGTNSAEEKLVHKLVTESQGNTILKVSTREKRYYFKDIQGLSFENVDWIFLSK
jgi:hypothetical protein